MTKEELLSQEGFTEEQKNQATLGFKNGLTVDQVAFYYRPELPRECMIRARWGFEKGLTIEQVSSYCKPEFTCQQMHNIMAEIYQKSRSK